MGCGGSKEAPQLQCPALEAECPASIDAACPASIDAAADSPPTPSGGSANPPVVPSSEPLEAAEEHRRLQALLTCHVLDTPFERRYDAICRLLCSVFKTPVAVVGLIDADRLWFKAIEGLVATGGRRLHSFCDASLKLPCPTMMVVPDTLADARFQLNQFVTSPPHVRFYCGAPLVSTEGCVLGSLAVMDIKPRTVSADCANLICQFAELVVRELERDKETEARAAPPRAPSPRVRTAACFNQAVLVCNVSAPGWPALFVNDPFCLATGMSEAVCLQGGFWDLFHFEAPKEMAQMLYAQAAIKEQKPFALAMVAGPPRSQGGQRAVLEFHPAGNDSFCEDAPQIAIPSFVQLQKQSGRRGATAGLHVVVLKPPPLPAILPLAAPPAAAPGPAAAAAEGGMAPVAAAGAGAVPGAECAAAGERPPGSACSESQGPALPRQPLQRLRVPSAAPASEPSVGSACLPPATPSGALAGSSTQLRPSRMSGGSSTPRTPAVGGGRSAHSTSAAARGSGTSLPSPEAAAAGRGAAPARPSPRDPFSRVLEIDTSAMPRLRLVHPPSGRASDASLLSGGALPSPVSSPAAPATPLAPWMPQPFDQACPEQLAEVTLGPLIGRGEHGRVYRGWWRADRVAVKIIDCTGAVDIRDPSNSGPLLEAALSKDLRHDNIVATHMAALHVEDASETRDGHPTQQVWLVQQYCNRGTIYDAIDRGWLRQQSSLDSPPDLRAVLLTAQEIASALAYLHAHNVWHGDLAGSNVLLTDAPKSVGDERGFTVKVSDFGLSRTLHTVGCKPDTIGTVSHMPPELLDGGRLSSGAADVFSLGTLCWEMYCSAHAWEGLRLPQIIHRKVVGRERLRLPDGCPAAFKAVVGRCMAHDPEARPSAEDVLNHLDAMLTSEE